MKVTVVANLDDAATLLRRRGLEPGGRVQQLFTNEVAKHADHYVPMSAGSGAHMKGRRVIKPDSITYLGPYARFHYFGKVMVGIHTRSAYAKLGEPKVVTAKNLEHHEAPKRGPFWDRRMWADKKHIIVKNVAVAAGGRAE